MILLKYSEKSIEIVYIILYLKPYFFFAGGYLQKKACGRNQEANMYSLEILDFPLKRSAKFFMNVANQFFFKAVIYFSLSHLILQDQGA